MAEYIINSEESKEKAIREINELYNKHKYLVIPKITTGKTRTNTQNAALHKYFEMLASELNEKHLDMRHVLKMDIDMPWSTYTVKDFLWKPVQAAIQNNSKTSECDRSEYAEVYDILNRHLIQKLDVYVPWPSRLN